MGCCTGCDSGAGCEGEAGCAGGACPIPQPYFPFPVAGCVSGSCGLPGLPATGAFMPGPGYSFVDPFGARVGALGAVPLPSGAFGPLSQVQLDPNVFRGGQALPGVVPRPSPVQAWEAAQQRVTFPPGATLARINVPSNVLGLNVRVSPSPKSPLVTGLRNGTVFQMLDPLVVTGWADFISEQGVAITPNNRWAQIKTASGLQGYLRAIGPNGEQNIQIIAATNTGASFDVLMRPGNRPPIQSSTLPPIQQLHPAYQRVIACAWNDKNMMEVLVGAFKRALMRSDVVTALENRLNQLPEAAGEYRPGS